MSVLWRTFRAIPQYRGKTTLIVTTDHGRGIGPHSWRHHGAKISGSDDAWIAIIGPDTQATGEVQSKGDYTIGQIAATLAAFLGEDYCAAVPKAAPPIVGALDWIVPAGP